MKSLKYLVVAAVLMLLTGCSKDELSDLNSESQSSFSSVAVFNTIPGSSSLTLSTGNEPNSIWIVSGSEKFNYNSFLTYRNWFPGNLPLNIEYSYNGAKNRVLKNLNLEAGKFYSLFLTKGNNIETILSEDNILKPRQGYAKVRFVHMSMDAPSINASPFVGSNFLFDDIKFKDVTSFQEIDVNRYNSWLIESKDPSHNLSITSEFKMEVGKIYTLLLKGLVNTDIPEEEISLSVIKH